MLIELLLAFLVGGVLGGTLQNFRYLSENRYARKLKEDRVLAEIHDRIDKAIEAVRGDDNDDQSKKDS